MNSHFKEIRKRIINCIIIFITTFFILFFFSDKIYTILSYPLTKNLPENGSIIATKITSTLIVPMRLSFLSALILNIPFFMYNLWSFISPGLYKNEKNKIIKIILGTSLLFYTGIIFAFYIILPITLKFFTNCSPDGVIVMTDISNYLTFMTTILIITGLSFQIPIFTALIINFDIISKEKIKEKRPYVIVLTFTISMLITPPDVISQILLAIPLIILFELGIIFSKTTKKNQS